MGSNCTILSEVPNDSSEKTHVLLGFARNGDARILPTGPG